MKEARVLFVHNGLTSFIKIDKEILSTNYKVEELGHSRKYLVNPFKVWSAVSRNDLVFAWFASWHSLLPVIFASLMGKPSLLVTGGYDTANIPEAQYGNQRLWWKRFITNFILRRATHLICNSYFTLNEAMEAAKLDISKFTVLYHGIPDRYKESRPKSKMALNVGNVLEENLKRKGIVPFLEAGALVPGYRFVQVGAWKDQSYLRLQALLSENVEMKGYAAESELNEYYLQSKVYVQPSLHEGFGMSVVEAMQAGCIPLVSGHGALPEVVREYGIILEHTAPEFIAKGIEEAENFRYTPEQIREFALSRYAISSREQGLIECIKELLPNKEAKAGNRHLNGHASKGF